MKAYFDWIVVEALPFWAEAGFDAAPGRFAEQLDHAGQSLAMPHRAMVQARQIYVFAEAARRGWFAEGGRIAETAMASLLRDFARDDASQTSFAFSISPHGHTVSDLRDAYTHAFILFAIAALVRLTRDEALLRLAHRVTRFIDGHLTDPLHGGLFDAVPLRATDKRQNPHMHLLEAYLALEEAAPGEGFIERAGNIVDLFDRCLFRTDAGILPEHASRDWTACPDPARHSTWEPGHHFEWAWLLDRHAQTVGGEVRQSAARIYEAAVRHGLAATGMIYDEMDGTMLPTKRSHRLWPHTEAMKAAAARHLRGDSQAAATAQRMAEILRAQFVGRPVAGGWIDRIDAQGQPLVEHMPASSLYHLVLAASEAEAAFGTPGPDGQVATREVP